MSHFDVLARLDEEERDESRRRWRNGCLGILLLGALGAGGWYLWREWQTRVPVDPLPPALRSAASAARNDLVIFGRALRELVVESARKPAGNADKQRGEWTRRVERLDRLHRTGRTLEPRLTREEQRVLMALQNAERMLERYLVCEQERGAHCEPAVVQTALKQVDRGLAVARGEKIDDAVISDSKTLQALGMMRQALDPAAKAEQVRDIANDLGEIKKARARMNAAMREAMKQ